MNNEWILEGAGERPLRLRRLEARGRSWETIASLMTVQDVCRRLRKSRRQVYRYLRAGRLTACARILGQWLFDSRALDRFERASLPRSFRRFFWDVPLSSLSAETHRDFILGRLLEWGDREALRWVLRTCPRDDLVGFLRGRGREVLTRRSWRFWALLLKLDTAAGPRKSWRGAGRRWGGADPPLVRPLIRRGAIRIASPSDIGLMKIGAIIGRGSRKDFVDLYAVCRRIPLGRLFSAAPRKFKDSRDFTLQALKALSFFEDAQQEPPLTGMRWPWSQVRAFFESEVRSLARAELN